MAEYPYPTGPLGISVVDGDIWTTSGAEDRHPVEESTDASLGIGVTQLLATDEAVWVSQPQAGVVWRVTFAGR